LIFLVQQAAIMVSRGQLALEYDVDFEVSACVSLIGLALSFALLRHSPALLDVLGDAG
jgi:hypothetical protein